MGELLTGVHPVAALVAFCTCQNSLAWAGFWCAVSWELFEGFLSIQMRRGTCRFSSAPPPRGAGRSVLGQEHE